MITENGDFVPLGRSPHFCVLQLFYSAGMLFGLTIIVDANKKHVVSILSDLGRILLPTYLVTKSLMSRLMTGYLFRCCSNDGALAIFRSAKFQTLYDKCTKIQHVVLRYIIHTLLLCYLCCQKFQIITKTETNNEATIT